MPDRITRSDLSSAFANHVDALERYGVTYDGHLALDHGSPTYGRAWRIYRVPTGQTGHHQPPIGSDYLGSTARAAYDELTSRTRTIHDLARALDLPRHETALDRTMAALHAAVAADADMVRRPS